MRWTALAAGVLLASFALGELPAEARQNRRQAESAQPVGSETDLHFLVRHFRVLSPTAQVAVVQAIRDFMDGWE